MMKRLLLNCSLMAIQVLNLNGQLSTTVEQIPASSKTRVMEMGMNLYTLGFTNTYNKYSSFMYSYYPQNHAFDHYFMNGAYFKYVKGNNGIRVSANYFQKLAYFDQTILYSGYSDYPAYGSASTRTGEFKVGYQRLMGKRKLAPYFFTDFRYGYSQQKGSYYYSNHAFWCTNAHIVPVENEYLIEQSTFGVNGGLGLRLILGPLITFNLESNVEFYFSRSQDIKNSVNKVHAKSFALIPLQFSMGLRF